MVFPDKVSCHFSLTFLNEDYSFYIRNDWVKMYEGKYDTPIQGAFCGENYPSEIITNSTKMVIEFHSDDYGADTGFRIKIETGTIAIHTIKVYVNICYLIGIFIICTATLKLF